MYCRRKVEIRGASERVHGAKRSNSYATTDRCGDQRKCNDHDSLRISQRGSRRIVTMILRRLCRNVDVSPDKERSEKIRLGSFRQWRYIDNRSTYISTEIVVARYRGVSRATGKANLVRAGLTARCARQHGVAKAKSRRRAGCRVRSSGRRQSCGECDRANSHPAENGNRRGGACRMGLVAENVIGVIGANVPALTSESCEPDRTTSGKRLEPFRYRVIEDHEIPAR